MLLSEIFSLCNEINAFHLEVRESNIPAISLYKKNGFETDGMRKNFYSSPSENAILMTKRKN
jgi:ribosomal-protein-alanine N-acetyltransferase